MPIDYSKWDKIELSDDSDVEVHPNVDKLSFIRWKQRDIHEKRMQRNITIKSILVQLTMYAKLNSRVDFVLDNFKLSLSDLLDNTKVMTALDAKFDKTEKFDYDKLKKEKGSDLRKGLQDLTFDEEEIQNTPTYNEMIEDLFIQIKDDHPETKGDAQVLVDKLTEHRKKIDDVLSSQTIKLDELLNEKAQLISSDDYHTGFDRSFLNKDSDDVEPSVSKPATTKSSTTTTVTTTEVINSPAVAKQQQQPEQPEQQPKQIVDDLVLLPATEEFGTIPYTDLRASADFLIKHTKICSEEQKDALIMTAFDSQLEDNPKLTKQIIHQSLLLQYVAQLAGRKPNKDQIIKAVKLFFQ
jgi:cell division cycle protein 37